MPTSKKSQAAGSPGPKQHYIPASVIGRFSNQATGRRRERPVHLLLRGGGTAFIQTAASVAWARDLYTLFLDDPGQDPGFVDKAWEPVERRLPEALERLENTRGLIDAVLWGEVLVPFAAHAFVRGIDFGPRFRARWQPLIDAAPRPSGDELSLGDSVISQTNVNYARLFELMRLVSPVMRARWRVLRSEDEDARFVTSNLGYAPFGLGGEDGCVLPIGGSSAIHLVPRPRLPRIFLEAGELGWLVDVDSVSVKSAVVTRANRAIARHAPMEIYGASSAAVMDCHREMASDKFRSAELIWDDPRVLRRNQFELLKFLQVVSSPPGQPQLSFDEAVKVMRYPAPVPFQLNPEEGTGLSSEEEAAIAATEEQELAREHKRLCELAGSPSPLKEITPLPPAAEEA